MVLAGGNEELQKDHDYLLAGNVFTKDQIDGYIELKMEEIESYEHTPTQWNMVCTIAAKLRLILNFFKRCRKAPF